MSKSSFIHSRKLYGDIRIEATLCDCDSRTNSLKLLCGENTEFIICKDAMYGDILQILMYAEKDIDDISIENKITRFKWNAGMKFNVSPVTIYAFSEYNSIDNDRDYIVKVGILDPLDNLSCYKFRQKQNINDICKQIRDVLRAFINEMILIGKGFGVYDPDINYENYSR